MPFDKISLSRIDFGLKKESLLLKDFNCVSLRTKALCRILQYRVANAMFLAYTTCIEPFSNWIIITMVSMIALRRMNDNSWRNDVQF